MGNGRSVKDVDITTCAFLKSIIESGAPKDEWGDRLEYALNLHYGMVRKQLKREYDASKAK